MRRNSTRSGIAFFLGAFLLAWAAPWPVGLHAQETGKAAVFDAAANSIVLNPGKKERQKLLDSLMDGFTAAVRYKIKAYAKNEAKPSLFGERLIVEREYSFQGSYDPFADTYRIDGAGGESSTFGNFQGFLASFLRCHVVDVVKKTDFNAPSYFLFQVRLDYIDLHPPLNLLEVFLPANRFSSSWIRIDYSHLQTDSGTGP